MNHCRRYIQIKNTPIEDLDFALQYLSGGKLVYGANNNGLEKQKRNGYAQFTMENLSK